MVQGQLDTEDNCEEYGVQRVSVCVVSVFGFFFSDTNFRKTTCWKLDMSDTNALLQVRRPLRIKYLARQKWKRYVSS